MNSSQVLLFAGVLMTIGAFLPTIEIAEQLAPAAEPSSSHYEEASSEDLARASGMLGRWVCDADHTPCVPCLDGTECDGIGGGMAGCRESKTKCWRITSGPWLNDDCEWDKDAEPGIDCEMVYNNMCVSAIETNCWQLNLMTQCTCPPFGPDEFRCPSKRDCVSP